jgi:cell division inhibitor SepF
LEQANLDGAEENPAGKRKSPTMAIRDTWHRALVYFGLAEEYEEGPGLYEPETSAEGELFEGEVGEVEPAPRREARTASVRRLDTRRQRDEIDDIFADEPTTTSRERVLRPVGNGGEAQVHLVTPRTFNDAQEVADKFKRSIPVIMNLQSTDTDLSRRLIDFASGMTYALDGGMQKIADKTFLLTPRNVEVSAEQQARLVEKGFFNQS